MKEHYLAVSKVNGKMVLTLKKCPTENRKPISDDAEIIFKVNASFKLYIYQAS